jgi:hypothetical protein
VAEAPLYAAFVTRENALDYCRGVLTAPELWATAACAGGQTGPVLFINGLRGKMAWRTFARICEAVPPQGIVLASRVPSIVKRCEKFGQLMRCEIRADGPIWFYFGEGEPLREFLKNLCTKTCPTKNTTDANVQPANA